MKRECFFNHTITQRKPVPYCACRWLFCVWRIPNFGEPKIASPKNWCFHIAQYFTTSIKRKISNKATLPKSNISPLKIGQPLPFQGLLLSNSRGGSNWRTQAVLLVSLVSPPHDAAKEHLGAREIRKLQLGFVVDVFFGVEFGCWCCWNLFVGFVFGGTWFLVLLMLFLVGAYIVYLVQYPINGSIDVIGTFQNEWFWNVSSGHSSNNTFWGEVGWGNTFHWLATLCRKPSRWILFNLPHANNPPQEIRPYAGLLTIGFP